MSSIKRFLSNLYGKKTSNTSHQSYQSDPESLKVFEEKYYPKISEIITNMQNDIRKLRVGKFSLKDESSIHMSNPPSCDHLVFYDGFTVADFHWQHFENDNFEESEDEYAENTEFLKAMDDIEAAIMNCMKKYNSKLHAIHPGLSVELSAEDVDSFYISFNHPSIKERYIAPGLV